MKTEEQILKDIEMWKGWNSRMVEKLQLELRKLKKLKLNPKLKPAVEPMNPVGPKLDKKLLKAWNQKEQTDWLKKKGVKDIPRYEKDRVDLIFALQ